MKWYFLALKKYAIFGGRATRSEFWFFILFNFLVGMLVGIVTGFVAGIAGHQEISVACSLLYSLATLLPTLAVTVRRLHDTSRSAWWLLIFLVPFLGPVVLVVLLAFNTKKSENRYGPNPSAAKERESVGSKASPGNKTDVGRCPKCGQLCSPDDQYCGECAAPLQNTRMPASDIYADKNSQLSRRNKRRAVITAALVAVVVVAVTAVVLVRHGFRSKNQSSGLTPLGPIVQVPPAVLFRGATRPVDGSSVSPSQADIAAAERDLARHPDDPKALNDLGCLLDASGATTRGDALLSQARRLRPDDPDIGYNYGRSLFRQGKIDEAGKEADRLVAQNPDSAEARLLKASVAIQKRDYNTAQDQVAKVLKKDAEQSNPAAQTAAKQDRLTRIIKAIQMAALVIQGVVDLAKGRTQEGLASFQAALKLGDDAAAMYNAGVAYQQLRQPAQAVPYYQRAIQVQPNLAEAHNNLGGLMLAQHDLSGAQRELSAAASLKPELRPSIEKAFQDASKPDAQTTGLIAFTEIMRSFQNAVSRLIHGKKTMTMQEAVNSKAVEAVGQLTENNSIRVQLKKTSQAESGILELSFSPGSVLKSSSAEYSDLVITKVLGRETEGQRYIPGPVSLSDSEPEIYAFGGYLAAIKKPPQNADLSVATSEPDPVLVCIAGQNQIPDGNAIQVAIWMETEGINKMQQLRRRLQINDTDWSAAELLFTQCKTQAR
jgi:uncharacterized membrane protein YhaH (DUF805 family)/tetratricopeptide (TPR) repeat protein